MICDVTDVDCWCGGRSYQVLAKTEFRGHGSAGYPFSLLRCRHCGLIRVYPLPALDFATGTVDTCDLQRNAAAGRAIARRRVSLIKRFLPQGRLLDFGANIGLAMEAARDQGFQTEGVEIDRAAVAIATAKRLTVHCGSLEQLRLPAASYDAVLASHVLEHLPDPKATLSELRRLLRPGGLLFMAVPNYGSLASRVLGLGWVGLCPQKHIWMFEPRTLRANLIRDGWFDLIKLTTGCTEPLSIARRPLPWIKTALAQLAALAGSGDELVIVLRRR